MTTAAIATAIFLEGWLETLATKRGMSVTLLARELRTTPQLVYEIARAITHDGIADGEHAFVHKTDLPKPSDPPTLRQRVAQWHYDRLKQWELDRADEESDAILDKMMHQ